MFVTSKFNPDDLSLRQINDLTGLVSKVDLNNGYTKADLESIESLIPGVLSDVDGFNINEYGSLPTKTNIGMVERRLSEVDNLLRTRLRSISDSNLVKYRSTIRKFKSLSKILETIKDTEPNPIGVEDQMFISDGLGNYNGEVYNKLYTVKTIELSKAVTSLLSSKYFLKYSIASSDVKFTADRINLLLDRWYLSNEFKPQLESSIMLKTLLSKTEIFYEDIVQLLMEPERLQNFMDKTLTELFNSINRTNGLLNYDDWLSDKEMKNWINEDVNILNLTKFADDDTSLIILAIVAIMRYRKPIEL